MSIIPLGSIEVENDQVKSIDTIEVHCESCGTSLNVVHSIEGKNVCYNCLVLIQQKMINDFNVPVIEKEPNMVIGLDLFYTCVKYTKCNYALQREHGGKILDMFYKTLLEKLKSDKINTSEYEVELVIKKKEGIK